MTNLKQFVIVLIIMLSMINSQCYSQDVKTNHLLIVKAYVQNEQAQLCIDYYKQLNESQNSEQIQLVVGDAFYMLSNYKEAANVYLLVNTEDPKLANLELAKCYAMLNKPEFATKYLEAYLNLRKRISISELRGIKAFSNIDESDAWNSVWLKDWYSANDLLYNDALYEYRIDSKEDSEHKINELLEKRPSYHQAYKLLADIKMEAGKYGDAISNIDKAIELNPKNQYYRMAKSEMLLAFDKANKALKEINYAITIDSSEIDFYIQRVKVYLKLDEYELAQNELEMILEYNSSNKVYRIAGDTYFKNENYLTALKYYNRCLEKESLNPDLYIARGDVYAKSGIYEFAEKDFSMALDFYPTKGELYFKRALVRIDQKKYEKVCLDLNKAREFGYLNADDYLKRYCQ